MTELLMIPGYSLEISKNITLRKKGRLMVYVKLNSGFTRKQELEHDKNDLIVMDSREITVVGIYSGFKLYENETAVGNFERL